MAGEQQLPSQALYDPLVANGVNYFCGVPDSITGPFSNYLDVHANGRHITTANEGNAIGLAIGYHMATGQIPLAYMQNSGLSNAIDPLASLADRSVLGTPLLLLVGWRGQPGKHDEPHHTRQGAVTPDLLQSLDIPCDTLLRDPAQVDRQVSRMVAEAGAQGRPHALLVEQGTFAGYAPAVPEFGHYPMSREEAVAVVAGALDESALVVAGIGKLSRELSEYRHVNGQDPGKDLLAVGGMGHASSIALGIAQQMPEKKVFCLDGDGSVLMHLGALATIGNVQPANFYHVVFNNGSHDSVGGHPTASPFADLPVIARACGYRYAESRSTPTYVRNEITRMQQDFGPAFLEVKVRPGARPNLTRPALRPSANKAAFMSFLK